MTFISKQTPPNQAEVWQGNIFDWCPIPIEDIPPSSFYLVSILEG